MNGAGNLGIAFDTRSVPVLSLSKHQDEQTSFMAVMENR